MHGYAVFKGDNTQVPGKLFDPYPMTDSAICRLNFPLNGIRQRKQNPFGLDVRALEHDIVFKILGGLHGLV